MSIFTNLQFLKLWGNQIFLQVAFNMTNFTALLVIDHLTQSRFALATFYAAMTLPAFIVGVFAGAVVDLTDRKRLMLVTDLLLSGFFAAYALSSGSYPALLVIAFATSSVAQFFIPAEAATIPVLVKSDDLDKANSLFLFTELGSVLIGYALAGPIIQAFGGLSSNGASAAFAVASGLTALGFLLRLSLRNIEHEKPEVIEGRIFRRTMHLTREVLSEARHNPKISVPIALLTAMEFNIGILAILFISFVREYLHLPTEAASYYLILPLIGGLGIGIYFLNKFRGIRPRSYEIFIGAVGFALVVILLGITAKLISADNLLRVVTIVASVITGITAVFIQVNAQTVLQRSTRSSMLGRTFSLAAISASAVAPIPVLLVSFITEKVDVTTVFLILGLLLLAGSVLLRPYLMHLNES